MEMSFEKLKHTRQAPLYKPVLPLNPNDELYGLPHYLHPLACSCIHYQASSFKSLYSSICASAPPEIKLLVKAFMGPSTRTRGKTDPAAKVGDS